jgi:hypothetical protein
VSAVDAGTSATPSPAADRSEVKPPLYWRLLRLRTLRPNGWQRAMLVEGVLTVAVILVLADVASAWTLLVLPLASVVLVKGHDLLATALRSSGPGSRGSAPPAGPTTDGEDANGATRTG